jgi:hypothetical protein
MLHKRKPVTVSRHLKFLTGNETPKSLKLPGSKGISKKPPTKFQEFRLSHSKLRLRGRRNLLDDLYKTNEKEQVIQQKRKKPLQQI